MYLFVFRVFVFVLPSVLPNLARIAVIANTLSLGKSFQLLS